MNRGSANSTDRFPRISGRFNEAPIHESGKSHQSCHLERGFRRASMRPRFMNRGSPSGDADALRPAARFNEAPIHESGK